MRVALYTIGVFRERADHPVNQGFYDRHDPSMEQVESAPGFIARSGYDRDPGPLSWGEQVWPTVYKERGDGWCPATLSLWEAPGAIAAFAYRDVHGEAVRLGRTWFVEPDWPPFALWWVADDHIPDWSEAVERHGFLHENGPSPSVFDLRIVFDPDGKPMKLDTGRWLQTKDRS